MTTLDMCTADVNKFRYEDEHLGMKGSNVKLHKFLLLVNKNVIQLSLSQLKLFIM